MGRQRNKKFMRMPEEIVEGLKQLREEFRRKFGRDPGPNDPVFFDPNASTPRPYPFERAEAEVAAAMKAAGVAPDLIHAFVRTGMIVTEDNLDVWSKEDLAEWDAAIEEYRRKARLGP